MYSAIRVRIIGNCSPIWRSSDKKGQYTCLGQFGIELIS